MTEFRIIWQACPHIHHPTRVCFVEAADEASARAVATDHIERSTGIAWYSIHSVEPYTRPQGGKMFPQLCPQTGRVLP